MAAIDLSSISAPLNDGILQLQNGVAMSSTLTSVTDQSNTASTLKLSTTSAQFTSPLRITTDDPSDFYLDCEDGSTNNRFSITRNTASQQVNLNFASNPAGSTTIVGAVRTYVDGVNLSEIMTFREDGYINAKGTLQVGTDGQNGTLQFPTTVSGFATSIYTTYVNNRLTLQCGSATRIEFQSWLDFISSNSTLRIDGGTHTTTLSTSAVTRFVNTGSAGVNTTYFVNTNVGVNETSPTAKFQIKGSGSTSATTSLLVQNSSGTESLRITDDRVVKITSSAGATALNVEFGNINSNVKILSHGSSDFSQIQIGTNFSLERNGGGDPTITTTFGLGVICNSLSLQTSTNAPCKLWIRGNYGLGSAYFGANNSNGTTASTLYFQNSETPTAAQNVVATFNLWAISDNATAPTITSSSMFSLESTTRGFLPPRMTDAQIRAIVAPAEGLIAYNTTISHLCCYQAGAWVKFSHSPM